MINGIGWGMYLFFAVWLLIGALFIWFFVAETLYCNVCAKLTEPPEDL